MRIAEPLRPHADLFVIPDGRAVVALSGELDIAAVPLIREAFAEAVDQTAIGVIADMSRVSFIDASGLGALVGAANRTHHLPGGMNLSGVPAHMNKLLRIAGLSDHFRNFGPPRQPARTGVSPAAAAVAGQTASSSPSTFPSTFPSPRDPLPIERRPIRGAVIWAAAKPDVTASLFGRISR
jgi:anti-sigma B factor antagonist